MRYWIDGIKPKIANFCQKDAPWLQFWQYVLQRFYEDGCTYRAAALTFTGLLALVPLMAVVLAALSAFPMVKVVSGQIESWVFANFVPASGDLIQHYLQQFVAQSSQLSAFGILFLLVTAILMMFTIEQAFNTIWRVRIQRRGIAAFLLYWAVLTLSPVLVGLSLVISSYLFTLPLISGTVQTLNHIKPILLACTPFVLSVVTFTLLYVAVPNCSVKIKHGLFGAFVAAILFEVAKAGFAFYVTHVPTYDLLYGALAAIPIFLIWIYLSWLIILFGAEVTHACDRRHKHRSGVGIDGVTHAFLWLTYLWQAQRFGDGLSLTQLIAKDVRPYQQEPEVILQVLMQAKLIEKTADDRYLISRDLNTVTFAEFYHHLPWPLPEPNQLREILNQTDSAFLTLLTRAQTTVQQELNVPMTQLVVM